MILFCGIFAFSMFAVRSTEVQAKETTLMHLQKDYRKAKVRSTQLQEQMVSLTKAQQQVASRLAQTEQSLIRAELQQRSQEHIIALLHAQIQQDRRMTDKFARKAEVADTQLRGQLEFWYEQGSLPYIEVLLAAHSFSDFLYRVSAMDALLVQQKEVFTEDARILKKFEVLTAHEKLDEQRAQAVYASVKAGREKIAASFTVEKNLIAHVETLKSVAQINRGQQIEMMQRLASQIAAVEMEQARMAAEEAAKKAKNYSAVTAPPAGALLNSAAVQNDLTIAISDTDVPRSWLPWLLLLVQYESGGNPSAQCPVAVDGEHASGLMQMLPETFARYALAGHDNIWNPVDNAIAAIRYIQAAYGSPWNIPGIQQESTYRGY